MNLETHIKPELWAAIQSTYQSENYSHAILDAMHFLSDVLREKSGADGDGHKLAHEAMGGDPPKLRINKLQTQTEKDEQKGVLQILMGLYQGIRNPRSHELNQDNQSTADAIIYFINHLLGIIDQSQQPFTLERFLKDRVFDRDFVASDRYARLLIAEIPEKKRLDTLIEIYRRRMEGSGENIRFVVDAVLQTLSEDEIKAFLSVVSEDFKVISEDDEIRSALQMLPPDLWPQISELARLRVENKLITLIKSGNVIGLDGKTHVVGALATWANSFLSYFTLRDEVIQALFAKLESQYIGHKRYVAEYFLSVLPNLMKDRNIYLVTRCIKLIAKAAREDVKVELTLARCIIGFPEKWQEALVEDLKDLTDSENPRVYLYNGMPFLKDTPTPYDNLGDIPF